MSSEPFNAGLEGPAEEDDGSHSVRDASSSPVAQWVAGEAQSSPHGDPIPVVPVAPVAAMAAPKFCRQCGTPWQEGWVQCEPCTDRHAASSLAGLDNGDDIRSVKTACALYFAMLAISGVALVAGLVGADELWTEVFSSLGFAFVVTIWVVASWRDIRPLLGRVPHPRWMLAGAGMGVVTFAFAAAVVGGITSLVETEAYRYSDTFLDAGYGWGVILLFIAIQPAVFEELAFRGVINSSLSRVLSVRETIVVGALMFMILHLAPAMFPHTLAMGIAAGYIRLRSGSLYPCILLHFVHNSLCVVMEWAGIW